MSEVKRYYIGAYSGEAEARTCSPNKLEIIHQDEGRYFVLADDFDRVTAELQRLLDHKEQQRESELRNGQAGDRLVGELQQRLTAADERADALEGLLQRVVESSVLSFEQDAPESLESLEADICAALKPATAGHCHHGYTSILECPECGEPYQ